MLCACYGATLYCRGMVGNVDCYQRIKEADYCSGAVLLMTHLCLLSRDAPGVP